MIIYMECTLKFMLATGTPREAVDMIIHSGESKSTGSHNYVIVDGKYHKLNEIIEKRPE